jgi:signal transduction histidine kinase
MFHVIGCITQQHDLRFVVLAGVLCLFASFTAMTMITRARDSQGRMRIFWIVAAGTVAGSGIWGTHFVAMLAYRAGIPVGYDMSLTLFSILIAAAVSSGGFALTISRIGPAIGGAIIGMAISAMHYEGMEAVRVPADAIWSLPYVVASVVIGVVLTAVAMHIALRWRGVRASVTGAGIFTLAICGMHFTAMAAVVYVPDPTIAMPNAILDPGSLAIAVAAVAILIVALGLIGAMLDNHLANRASSEAARLRAHITELEETKLALEATSARLGSALDAAAAASQVKSQFLATMSHELRTPLNAVIGFSEILKMESFGPLGSDRYREYVKDIADSGAHLLSLINDILDLSRLDAAQAALEEDDLDFAKLISETVRMVSGQAEAAGVELSEHIQNNLPHVRGDRRRIRQVLINLLSNAIKFTPAKGSVRVSATSAGGEIAVAVSDTGIGIASEDIPKAFERFGQVDGRLSRRYEGMGLGLPLAKQLMELHGGRLELASAPTVGTTVTIIFPAERIIEIRQVA